LSFALIAAALAAFARAAACSAALSDNAVDAVRMAGGWDVPGKTASAGCSFGRGQVSTALAAPRSADDCSSRERCTPFRAADVSGRGALTILAPVDGSSRKLINVVMTRSVNPTTARYRCRLVIRILC
jgi:hypothetical protein